MTTSIEYALMASSAYAVKDTVTHENNTIPIPNGWVDMEIDRTNDDSGFTARAYRNIATGEIVIAYTGTTFEGNVADKAKDWVLANIPAGSGAFLAPQVTDAAKFYLDVLNANPGAQISFTGHSLGGGLSSLMAVFFDRPATVFDEAPFEKSADSKDIVDELMERLAEYAIRHKAQGRGVRPMV
jgi:putative lipase involved disintegration of autophagic bodies